jgi:hypothetical protein
MYYRKITHRILSTFPLPTLPASRSDRSVCSAWIEQKSYSEFLKVRPIPDGRGDDFFVRLLQRVEPASRSSVQLARSDTQSLYHEIATDISVQGWVKEELWLLKRRRNEWWRWWRYWLVIRTSSSCGSCCILFCSCSWVSVARDAHRGSGSWNPESPP